jgi:hypothetical protein
MIQSAVKSAQFVSKHSISILMCSKTFTAELLPNLDPYFDIHNEPNLDMLRGYLQEQSLYTLPDVILLEIDEAHECFEIVSKMKAHPIFKGLVFILLTTSSSPDIRLLAMKAKVNDLYVGPLPIADLRERIKFLVKFKLIKPQLTDLSKVDLAYDTPVMKRLFDVVTSSLVIILLSPLFIIVAVMVMLDSKGPAIFKSKRVGAGYRIFDFYKFRSMRVGASTELSDLSALNQYGTAANGASTFLKLKDDPRTTRFGKFIRKFSIDELPQLFNVLKGDMSLVGNRYMRQRC